MLQLSENLRTMINRDGAVVLDLEQGRIVRCNQAGGVILDLLSRTSNQAAIITAFARVYGLSAAAAEPDVCAFLAALESQGLLRRIEAVSREE